MVADVGIEKKMNGTEQSNLHAVEAKQPDRKHALLWRLPTPLAWLILIACLCGPYAVAIAIRPVWGLCGALVVPLYIKLRYPGRSFGPMWLSFLDMAIILGNAILALMVLAKIIISSLK